MKGCQKTGQNNRLTLNVVRAACFDLLPDPVTFSRFSRLIYEKEKWKEMKMDIQKLYETYFSTVYKYIYSLSRDAHTAEEVTQETFFKALRHASDFRGDCRLSVWLCQIAKNCYLDELRKRKRQNPPDVLETMQSTDDLEGRYIEKEKALRIHEKLHRLKEPYKEVFSLRVFGELSFREIGELFGKSENWARVTYHRARMRIKEELENEDHL